jgi:hypothetical protein
VAEAGTRTRDIFMTFMVHENVAEAGTRTREVQSGDEFSEESDREFQGHLQHACRYQRLKDTESYHKLPLPLLEYQKMCSERAHFVWGDTALVCGLCGQHGPKGCLDAVNFKRIVDETGPVLHGSSYILALVQKMLAERLKNKVPGAVNTRLVEFVDKGKGLLDRFEKAMSFERKHYKGAAKKGTAHVAQDDPDKEVVQKATDGLQPKELAKQIAGNMQRVGVPSR